MRAALPLLILAAGCGPRGMSAGEATDAANVEVGRALPRFDRSGRTVRTEDSDGKWRVTYESPGDLAAGGPLIVEVDKRTRAAAIVQMAQ